MYASRRGYFSVHCLSRIHSLSVHAPSTCLPALFVDVILIGANSVTGHTLHVLMHVCGIIAPSICQERLVGMLVVLALLIWIPDSGGNQNRRLDQYSEAQRVYPRVKR